MENTMTLPGMKALNLEQQKLFIISNAYILNTELKTHIMNIVLVKIGTSVISENTRPKGVDINLDEIEKIDPSIITHIYNMVIARRENLSHPVIN
jgi:hypothetical protein